MTPTVAWAELRDAARRLCRRVVVEDDGQELVESGLLTLLVVAVGFIVFIAIRIVMNIAYITWGASILGNWEPSPPT